MTVHALRDQPPPELARALAEFEMGFTYPLGPGRSFRISHGDDYPRFFRAMGDARCFVAERAGQVVGALGVAIRPLVLPDGSTRQTAYIGDLKVDAAARGSTVFLRLAQAADAWARPQVTAAYGVVMDGTRASPTDYTGRAGIEPFGVVGIVRVLRLATGSGLPVKLAGEDNAVRIVPEALGQDCYRALSAGRYAAAGSVAAERSEIPPIWLMAPEGHACGRLEDTRRAKRLIDSSGVEMRSAHLACFAWRTQHAAAAVLSAACQQAARKGFPALFVAVAQGDLSMLESAIGEVDRVVAPATIYGAGIPAGASWNINTSEIQPMSRAPRVTAIANAVLERVSLLKNPYFTALADGSMSLPQFRATQEQFYYAVRYFPRPLAALASRIPDSGSRLDLVHNIVEEHGDFDANRFHQNTFRAFLASIGGQSPDVAGVPIAPAVHAFNNTLMAACLCDEIDTGVCCMGAIEHAFADISALIGQTVVRRGWVATQSLVHYALHAELDLRHAEEFFAIAEPRWDSTEGREAIRQGLELGVYAFDQLYRSLLVLRE